MRRQSVIKHVAIVAWVLSLQGCFPPLDQYPGTEDFPRTSHALLPEAPSASDTNAAPWQVASGQVQPIGPDQPLEFTHFRHVTELGMQCEYCHANARRSIHAGVPETKVCAGCHWQVKKDNPRIAKITSFGEGCDFVAPGTLNDKCEPIAWSKVHDLPDFVHFNHSRHVQGGVQCTECHGQIGLQGKIETWTETDEESGKTVEKTGIPEGHVMVREASLQMGWCLDCHASHPSIDANYGEKADLRRAELKDCWTCHK